MAVMAAGRKVKKTHPAKRRRNGHPGEGFGEMRGRGAGPAEEASWNQVLAVPLTRSKIGRASNWMNGIRLSDREYTRRV